MTTLTAPQAAPSATRRGGAAPAGLNDKQSAAWARYAAAVDAMARRQADNPLDPAETWADAYFERMKTDD